MSLVPLHIADEAEMAAFAAKIAPYLKTGDVVTLDGDLGAGKTAFTRALVNAIAPAPEEVPSPTFTLVQVYDAQNPAIWHFDLYRIEDQVEIMELGWEEALRYGVSVIEWPSRLGSLLPKDRLEISISLDKDSENKRIVRITPHGIWMNRQLGI